MRNAIGIIRVSQRAGREGEAFISPDDQLKRIEEVCKRDALELISVAEEIDVSGGADLEGRDGLREAIEAIEANQAEIVVVAYFDRLFRSIAVQGEVVSRIEAAGGEVLALDFGRISEATAAQWLSGTMMGLFADYQRRQARERGRTAQEISVERGIPPFPSIPAGLMRGDDRRLVPSPDAPVVVGAFERRAAGDGLKGIRKFLREHGIELTIRGVQSLFSTRLLLGEIHFGDLVNLEAHEPVIERELWDRVQATRETRGARAKSDMLLARLGVLRCGTCGGRMSVGTQTSNGRRYPFYRCSPVGDCPQRVTIGAAIVEPVVVKATIEALGDIEGRAKAQAHVRGAELAAATAQEKLERAVRVLRDFMDEDAAKETLEELRDERDRAKAELGQQLGNKAASIIVTAGDWDSFTLMERRDLIRATIKRVDIAPGRGADRITVHPFV